MSTICAVAPPIFTSRPGCGTSRTLERRRGGLGRAPRILGCPRSAAPRRRPPCARAATRSGSRRHLALHLLGRERVGVELAERRADAAHARHRARSVAIGAQRRRLRRLEQRTPGVSTTTASRRRRPDRSAAGSPSASSTRRTSESRARCARRAARSSCAAPGSRSSASTPTQPSTRAAPGGASRARRRGARTGSAPRASRARPIVPRFTFGPSQASSAGSSSSAPTSARRDREHAADRDAAQHRQRHADQHREAHVDGEARDPDRAAGGVERGGHRVAARRARAPSSSRKRCTSSSA